MDADYDDGMDSQDLDLIGPNSKHVMFISGDNQQFVIEREHAMISSTIKIMLEHPEYFDRRFFDIRMSSIFFKGIPSYILNCVCQYFLYYARYEQSPVEEIPKFFVSPDQALEVTMAAIFFDI